MRGITVRPNKELKLTSVERIGRSQLNSSVRWTRRRATERTRQPGVAPGVAHDVGRPLLSTSLLRSRRSVTGSCEHRRQDPAPHAAGDTEASGSLPGLGAEAASLFSEARTQLSMALQPTVGAENASLFSEALAVRFDRLLTRGWSPSQYTPCGSALPSLPPSGWAGRCPARRAVWGGRRRHRTRS